VNLTQTLLDFTGLDDKRNETSKIESYKYSLRNIRIPIKEEKSFWKKGKRPPYTIGIPLLPERTTRLGTTKTTMERPILLGSEGTGLNPTLKCS
jgi:hypothetical protein